MKTITELYEEANGWSPAGFDRTVQELERFAALVRADERRRITNLRQDWQDIPQTIPQIPQEHSSNRKLPVAWMVYTQDGQSVYVTDNPTDIQKGQRALPLYTGEE